MKDLNLEILFAKEKIIVLSRRIKAGTLCQFDQFLTSRHTILMKTHSRVSKSICLLFFVLFSPLLKAVELGQVTYETEMDKKIQLEKVALLPGFDNMNQVYSKPLTEYLRQILLKEHRFTLVEKDSYLSFPAEEYFKSQKELQTYFRDAPFDFAFQVNLLRQPKGLSLILTMYWKDDAAPLAQDSIRDLQSYDTPNLEKELSTLYRALLKKFPFDGHILSRSRRVASGETPTGAGANW